MLLQIILMVGASVAAVPTEPLAVEAAEMQAAETASPNVDAEIEAGLAAFRRLRFHEAEKHFQAAVEADPQSAAATWYLGYTVYKIAEPKHPFHPDKQRAAQLFARAYELDPSFRPVWVR
jgi:tetratricopeptide (TPR) repeat protein